MRDKLYIDKVDAFVQYGIFVSDGGYKGVVQWPALKPVDTNDWPEMDGVDADLSAPKLNKKEFDISFCCVNNSNKKNFISLLSDGAYHVFNFAEIGTERKLRLVSNPSVSIISSLEVFTLKFSEDKCEVNSGKTTPVPISPCWQRGFYLDGVDLSSYGVWITDGWLANTLKTPDVRSNLEVAANSMSGVIYEDSIVVMFKSRDITLPCVLACPSKEVFWHNYDSLLFDLLQPKERVFKAFGIKEEFGCYYKSCNVKRFALVGSVWCEFDLTLTVSSVIPQKVLRLLASEDGRFIISENGVYIEV